MTDYDTQRDIDTEGQRAIPRATAKTVQADPRTVRLCIEQRATLGQPIPGACPHCAGGPCDGFYARSKQPPGGDWENERVATALRTLADQVERGDWSGVTDALAILGARLDRRRGR